MNRADYDAAVLAAISPYVGHAELYDGKVNPVDPETVSFSTNAAFPFFGESPVHRMGSQTKDYHIKGGILFLIAGDNRVTAGHHLIENIENGPMVERWGLDYERATDIKNWTIRHVTSPAMAARGCTVMEVHYQQTFRAGLRLPGVDLWESR